MAKRSNFSLEITPDYGRMGEGFECITVKLYYNGKFKARGKHNEYIGGSVEYFDFVDIDTLGLIELWGFADEVGFKEKDYYQFWHKIGRNFGEGRYLKSDKEALDIRNHIPKNYEVEIYIEHQESLSSELRGILSDSHCDVDGSNDEDENEEQYESFEDERLVDSIKGKSVVDERDVSNELLQDNEDDVCDCEEGFGSAHDSDDEERTTYPIFDRTRDSENPEFKLGLIFNSKQEAKFAIETYCIRDGKAVNFVKNDNIRLWAKCKYDGCKWMIHVGRMSDDSCWQVRTYYNDHSNCFWDYTNKSINSSWLGKTLAETFMTNPKLGTHEFRQEICTRFKVNVSRNVAYLAKRKALNSLEGTFEEQFRKIRDYCTELKRADEWATVVLKLSEDSEGARFQRLYICFSACRIGFRDAYRRIIGVDGCFLKGKYGGQLLAAVGLVPNNNIFPICYALVERETKDSWTWFLKFLDTDIGFDNEDSWTFMSDKQKGLIPAFESLFPYAEHRFCVRHLHSNMKHDGFKSLAIKNALWVAANATRIEEFRRRMQELKAIEPAAYEWLAKKPEHHWTKSQFSTVPKSDILLNNMCESFNSMILDAREMPIIQMFEAIRNILMTRFHVNREKAKKWNSLICPKIRDLLAKNSKLAAGYSPMMSDDMHFQIMNMSEHHTVDLSSRSYSCRKWDLTGIPCKHAICAIWCKKEEPETYIHHYYTAETYKRCYAMSIMPVNGPDLWPRCDLLSPLPPIYAEKIGRPAKLRRREPDEPPPASSGIKQPEKKATKLKGAKRCNKCRICGGSGHNQRSCKQNRDVQLHMGTQQAATTQRSSALPDKAPEETAQDLRNKGKSADTNTTRKDPVNQLVNIGKPAFVKGGTSFTTVSRLRSYTSARRGMGQSSSSLLNPNPSQESINKK